MNRLWFVIVGCLGIGIERCWKRLCEGQGYSWTSWFLQPREALSKENSWSFDLKHSVGWCVIEPVPSLFSGHHQRWLQAECLSKSFKTLMNFQVFPLVPLPVFSSRSLSRPR